MNRLIVYLPRGSSWLISLDRNKTTMVVCIITAALGETTIRPNQNRASGKYLNFETRIWINRSQIFGVVMSNHPYAFPVFKRLINKRQMPRHARVGCRHRWHKASCRVRLITTCANPTQRTDASGKHFTQTDPSFALSALDKGSS